MLCLFCMASPEKVLLTDTESPDRWYTNCLSYNIVLGLRQGGKNHFSKRYYEKGSSESSPLDYCFFCLHGQFKFYHQDRRGSLGSTAGVPRNYRQDQKGRNAL